MEIDTGQTLCALDNPIVAGMQLFLVVNFVLCAISALLLLFRLLRRNPALPSWCRALSIAAFAVHGFWCLVSVFVLSASFVESPDEAAIILLSFGFALVTGTSLLGLILAWRLRHHAAVEWTPALFAPSASSPQAPGVLPHA
jgi:hypothetical protein